jgi:hypothetical protein
LESFHSDERMICGVIIASRNDQNRPDAACGGD